MHMPSDRLTTGTDTGTAVEQRHGHRQTSSAFRCESNLQPGATQSLKARLPSTSPGCQFRDRSGCTYLSALRLRDLLPDGDLRGERVAHAPLPGRHERAGGHVQDRELPRHLPRAEVRGEDPPRRGRCGPERRGERVGCTCAERAVDLRATIYLV